MAVPLHVHRSGTGDAVVLLHAFPLSSAMWQHQRSVLGERYRVVTPDLRGFGDSPAGDDEPSLDAMADDVAAMLDDLGLDEVVLGGLSMGGYVTMAFLRRHPDRVRALVLMDTKAGADAPEAAANRLRIAGRLETEGTADVLVDDVLPSLLGGTSKAERPDVVSQVQALVEAAPPVGAAWAQRAMAARPDSFDALRAAAVPALVVRGDEDALSSQADTDAMVDALPQGRLVVLPGSGHLTAMEVPEALTSALSRFLAELPR